MPGQSKSKCHQWLLEVGNPKPEAHQPHGGGTGCKVVGFLKLSNVNTWRHHETQERVNLEQPDLALMLDLLQAKVWTLQSSLPTSFLDDLFVLARASQNMKCSFSRSQTCVSHAQRVDADPTGAMNEETDLKFATCIFFFFFLPLNPVSAKTRSFC